MNTISDLNPSHSENRYSQHPSFGWTEASEPVPIVGFDYDEVCRNLDGEEPQSPTGTRAAAADLLNDVFHWCAEAPTARAASLRFLALLAGCRPELLASRSYKSLATEFNVTKAAFCKTMMMAESKFQTKFSRTRRLEGREAMRQARLKQIFPKG